MRTEHVGSGIDQPHKTGLGDRVMEKVLQMTDPEPQALKDDEEAAKARRIEQERSAFDLNHKPTERDAQIDGSGARFEVDG
jgi:hypothetical protein